VNSNVVPHGNEVAHWSALRRASQPRAASSRRGCGRARGLLLGNVPAPGASSLVGGPFARRESRISSWLSPGAHFGLGAQERLGAGASLRWRLQSCATALHQAISLACGAWSLYGDFHPVQHVNRHGPTTAGGGFAADVGGPIIYTLCRMAKELLRLSVCRLALHRLQGEVVGARARCTIRARWAQPAWLALLLRTGVGARGVLKYRKPCAASLSNIPSVSCTSSLRPGWRWRGPQDITCQSSGPPSASAHFHVVPHENSSAFARTWWRAEAARAVFSRPIGCRVRDAMLGCTTAPGAIGVVGALFALRRWSGCSLRCLAAVRSTGAVRAGSESRRHCGACGRSSSLASSTVPRVRGQSREPFMRYNISIDTDPQQQEAASPRVLVVRSFSRYPASGRACRSETKG